MEKGFILTTLMQVEVVVVVKALLYSIQFIKILQNASVFMGAFFLIIYSSFETYVGNM